MSFIAPSSVPGLILDATAQGFQYIDKLESDPIYLCFGHHLCLGALNSKEMRS